MKGNLVGHISASKHWVLESHHDYWKRLKNKDEDEELLHCLQHVACPPYHIITFLQAFLSAMTNIGRDK
jgi:hypothetical protein